MFPVRGNLGYRPVEHIGHDGNPVFIGIHVFQHFHEPVPVRGKIVKRVIRVEQESIQAPIVNFHREHTGDVTCLRVLDKRFPVCHFYMEKMSLAIQSEISFIV